MFVLLAEPGIPTWLIQAFLVFIFVVLPLVRGVRESLAKKRELEQRRLDRVDPAQSPDGSDAPDAMDEARRRWEALMRGEEVSAPPAPPPPPIPRPTAASIPHASAAPPLVGQLSDMAPAPSENETEEADDEATADPEHGIPDEETLAREANARRLRVERGERSDFLRREREGGAGRRANVAPDALTSLGGEAAVTVRPARARAELPFAGLGDPRERRTALRRALVMSEVLGTPLGLTETGTTASGPVGLRPTS
jgi:hypothetical protein